MADLNWPQVKDLLADALEIPPDQRADFLTRICGEDHALRKQLEAFLAYEVPDESKPQTEGLPAAELMADQPASPRRNQPAERWVGPYRLLERIGEGGMGQVYRAEQRQPIKRIVALKLLKLGMDSQEVISRFEAERQALAVMNHPNVAKVFDAGISLDGRPYFVMEYVSGEPITTYCDKYKLTIRQRLELFVDACAAVHHSHQKAIIHRDIKSTNVLVTVADGKAIVKVIDFGVAKALGHRLTDHTLFTERGQMIGTPEYMSPEQAEMGVLDVDIRADIYSLGVLLYELLAGVLPFDPQKLRKTRFAEMQKTIREIDPPKPSARLTAVGDGALIAERRQTEPRKLIELLRGELDWIVMMAIEKDRTRRYPTANELGADVERYLKNEPILARPTSTSYRAKKFVRRHKVGVIAASAVAAALVAGIIGTSIGMVRAKTAATRAEKNATEAAAVNRMLSEILTSVDPNKMGDKVTVLQAIRDMVTRLNNGGLKDQPLVEATVRETIGDTLLTLSLLPEADENLTRALDLRTSNLPPTHPDIAESMCDMGVLRRAQRRFADAESLHRRALQIRENATPRDELAIATSMNGLGSVLQGRRQLDEAEGYYKRALGIRRRLLPANHRALGESMENLAWVLRDQRRVSEAEHLYREALENRSNAIPQRPSEIADTLSGLAVVLRDQRKFVPAERLFRDALAIEIKTFAPDNPHIITTKGSIVKLLQAQGRRADAESLVDEIRLALEARRKEYSKPHPELAHAISDFASLVRGQENLRESEKLLREALKMYDDAPPQDQKDYASCLMSLAAVLRSQGRMVDSRDKYRDVLTLYSRNVRPGHPDIARCKSNLASVLRDLGELKEAKDLFSQALEIDTKALPAVHRDIASDLSNLASMLAAEGNFAKAEPLFRDALKINRELLPADFPQYVNTVERFASALVDCGRAGEAETLLREALATQKDKLEPQDLLNDKTVAALRELLLKTHRELEANALPAQYPPARPSTRPAVARP